MTLPQKAGRPELPDDFVDLAFARRLEMAETMSPEVVDALRQHSPNAPIAAEEIAGGIAFFGRVDYPANQIVGIGLYGEVTAEALDRVEDFYRHRGAPSTIVVSPLSDASLPALLGERGYRVAEFNSVLIRRLKEEEPFTPTAGVEIERVSEDSVRAWGQVLAEGFGLPPALATGIFEPFAVVPHSLAFAARILGKIAGGGAGRVIASAKIAALYGAATLPEFRGRGVQTAIIAIRLHEAARAGCEYAVVSTQPGSGSQRNMERRGFRVAYTKVVMVREWPETTAAAGS